MNIAVAIDNIHGYSSDYKVGQDFCDKVKAKGHDVTFIGVGPSKTQIYAQSHSVDVMVQIAGGMCIGTLADFIYGIKKGYYKAKKACIPLYTYGWTKYDPTTWKAVRAHDDTFSYSLDMSGYLGKTLPTIYKEHSDVLMPFSYGKTVDEMVNKFLGGSTDDSGSGGGSSALELIKQVVSDWDMYGVELLLKGDTLTVQRSTTSNAFTLDESRHENNSVSIQDFEPTTSNTVTVGSSVLKDSVLVERFGTISETRDNPKNVGTTQWLRDMLQVVMRDGGHTIELKTLLNPALKVGQWVKLKLPTFDTERYYYISKVTFEGEPTMGLTLETAPPSRYVEVNVADTSDDETTDDESDDTDTN